MKSNSLSQSGLSLSQAQSISNLCNQRAADIEMQLLNINNAQKELKIGDETYIETVGNKMPDNVVNMLVEKSQLHACQAFIMENIKAKDQLIKEIEHSRFVSDIKAPEYPSYLNYDEIPLVNESWGWSQLTISEYNEYLEAEAFAAHIGQFIHKGGQLATLRKELPNIKTLQWIDVKEGEKTPLKVTVHHTSSKLLELHEDLAGIHRKHEQRVNYFKAKVKNLVTEENARISKQNAIAITEINAKNSELRMMSENQYKAYDSENLKLKQLFEESKQMQIKSAAALRIAVDPRFQPTIDNFLKTLEN
jgi:hypothetical protein